MGAPREPSIQNHLFRGRPRGTFRDIFDKALLSAQCEIGYFHNHKMRLIWRY